MLHVNSREGFTIAVSENKQLARIATSTVLSDNAFSIVVPLLDQVFDWRGGRIRALFQANGLALQEGEKAKTDGASITEKLPAPTHAPACSPWAFPPPIAPPPAPCGAPQPP